MFVTWKVFAVGGIHMHRETGARTLADDLIGDDLGRNPRLEEISSALDWDRIGALVSGVHSSREGRKSYPPLVMLKALFLQHLHDASDPQLEQRLNSDLSWRRFAGLGLRDGTPDHSTISRFRGKMVDLGLMRRLLEEVNAQLDGKGMILREGTVVDATLVQAHGRRPDYDPGGDGSQARSEVDPEATVGRRGVFGFKGHLSVDRGSWLVREARVTRANLNEVNFLEPMVMGDEAAVYADAAYESAVNAALLEGLGIGNALMHRRGNRRPLTPEQKRRNGEISRARMPAEGVFGYLKRTLGCRKARYAGIAKTEAELLLKSTVYNVVRSLGIAAAPSGA